ncbi:N(G),N(G)-dimethylarginine dimethylaminohydrolase [Candidatus Bathyarchaeota archaeon]|nr:N(G),N(G)-dimethylarginine dimethylaminohydrolase [Candidatus Bathyarchaeota archaeon]
MKIMNTFTVKYAVVRPVPDSYDHCVRTNTEKIDIALAKSQHAEYCRTLQKLGPELIWIKGENTLPDSCFVEDTAIVLGEKAIICNMKTKSRVKEVVEVAKVLEKLKETCYIKPPATIDGGDVLKIEDKVFVGLSARTNIHAIRQLRKILENTNFEIVPVTVHNVLHLKSACTYLGNNCVIVSKGHFDTDILRDYKKIVVARGEEYAADCLAINGTVLMAKGFPKTKKLVEKEGFFVKELEMSEFRRGDGALTCLSILW